MVNGNFDLDAEIIQIIKDIQGYLNSYMYKYVYIDFQFDILESYLKNSKDKTTKITEIDKLVNLSIVYDKPNIIYELLKFNSLRNNMLNLSYLLDLSCKYNKFYLAKTILELPTTDKNFLKKYGSQAFKLAVQHGYIDIVREFKKYISVEDLVKATSNVALVVSVTNNRYEVFLELIKDKYVQSILSNNNNQLLIYACQANAENIVKELLRFSLVAENIAAQDNIAFCQLAYKGYYNLVKLFLTYPAVIKDIHNKKSLDYYGGLSAYGAAVENNYNKVASLIGIVIKLKYYAKQLSLSGNVKDNSSISSSEDKQDDVVTEEFIQYDKIIRENNQGVNYTPEEKFKYLLFHALENSKGIVVDETIAAIYELYPSNFLKKYIDKQKNFRDTMYFHCLYGDKYNIVASLEIEEVFDGNFTNIKLKL